MNTTACPFDIDQVKSLQLDPTNITVLEVIAGETEYSYLCSYLTQELRCDSSVRLSSNSNCDDLYDLYDDEECPCNTTKEDKTKVNFKLGIGTFKINHNGENIYFIHALHGKPQGMYCLKYYTTLIIIVAGLKKTDVLKSFVEEVVSWGNKSNDKLIDIYSWDIENRYWSKDISKRKRDMSTVILPAGIKQKLISDLDNFLDESTSKWYAKHGIPYKRSYLFYGAPGTGKTSTIAALASYINRNIAYLHVSDPKMTDSMLKKALQRLPGQCVVVLEDVDALFSLNRKNLSDIPLSFSGLLNALDGIGGKDASIFVLTSNHIERLDSALIRPGRVDVRIEYPTCNDEQIKLMFNQFYPDSEQSITEDFVHRVVKLRETLDNLSTAALQQYFIAHRTSSAAEAVQGVDAEISSPFAKPNLSSLVAFTKQSDKYGSDLQEYEPTLSC